MPENPAMDGYLIDVEAWAIVATFCAVGGGGLFLWLRGKNRSLLPHQRSRAVSWGALEVFATLFLVQFLIPVMIDAILVQSGFFTRVYGPDFQITIRKENPLDGARLILWVSLLSFPPQVLTVLAWVGTVKRAYQLGLTTSRLAENVATACLSWVAIAPLIFMAEFVVVAALRQPPQEHPFIVLANDQPKFFEWSMIVFLATITAPVFEELFFRGFLQNWMAQRRWGMSVGISVALVLAYVSSQGTSVGVWPVLFVLVMIPAYFVWYWATRRWIAKPMDCQAIYGTALLFGAAHSSVWPTPIPLFLLGLTLGYLNYRTRSLVGPIVFHSLFNAVACLALLLGGRA